MGIGISPKGVVQRSSERLLRCQEAQTNCTEKMERLSQFTKTGASFGGVSRIDDRSGNALRGGEAASNAVEACAAEHAAHSHT